MEQKFCEQCGAARIDHHKFCTGCGEAFTSSPAQLDNHAEAFEAGEAKPQTDQIAPEPLQIEHSTPGPEPEPEFYQADVPDSWEDVPQKPKSAMIISILIVALIAGVLSWLTWGRDKPSQMVEVVLTGSANVRDRPSTSESKIITKFGEGKQLAGRWVDGIKDPDERWLEFEDSGRILYIWGGNVDPIADGPKVQESPKSITSTRYPGQDDRAQASENVEHTHWACDTPFDSTIILNRGGMDYVEDSKIDGSRIYEGKLVRSGEILKDVTGKPYWFTFKEDGLFLGFRTSSRLIKCDPLGEEL